VMFDALMARNMNDVAKALVGEHAGTGALMLQHGVGGSGGSVQHVIDVPRRNAVVATDFSDALQDATRWIVGRGGDLMNSDLVGAQIAIHDVGKRTADIDTDRLHAAGSFFRSECGACRASASFKRPSAREIAPAKTRNPRRISASLVFSLTS